MTRRSAPAVSDDITYRRARVEDAERTFEIVQEAQGDLDRRMGREPHAALPAARVIRFRHFCVRHDGDRFWVAEAGGKMIAAAYATLRDDAWYLDALHVVPAYQSRKIGSELIRRCLTGTGPTTALTVLTDALNPISNGLYLRFGMLPQESTLSLDGPIGEGAPAPGPAAAPLTSRPIDLARDGAVLAALDLVADLAAQAGAQTLHIRNFGSARSAVDWSVRRGLRLSGIGLMLSSRPVGQFEGYVTSGADALY